MGLTKVRGAGAEGLTLSSTALTIANGLTLTDGNVTLASGHGIDFSATSDATTTTAELLDDYEEGYFTPTMANSVTLDSSYNNLAYTKIGQNVTIGGQIRIGSSSNTNAVAINNLPYTARANNPSGQTSQGYHWADCRLYAYNVPTCVGVGLYVEPNTTVAAFQTYHDDAVTQNLAAVQSGWLMFHITYFSA